MEVVVGLDLDAGLEAAITAGVVGCSAALASPDGEVMSSCAGTTSKSTPTDVEPATPFRTGSIAKVYTAAVLAELLDRHSLSIDTAVVEALPRFRLADGSESALKIRHLLTHTSGLNTDLWDFDGDGPGAIEDYVNELASVTPAFLPGATWAYSNSGFVVAGRIIEVLANDAYGQVLEAFCARMGLSETFVFHGASPPGAANGHYQEGGAIREAGTPEEGPALLPAGSGLFATARDVAGFAALLVRPDSPLERAAQLMRRPFVQMPPAGRDEPTHHGLGWKIYDWPKGLLVGHNGNGTGQFAWVRADVASGCALAVMVNTIPTGAAAWGHLAPDFYRAVGAEPSPLVKASDAPAPDAAQICGTYRMSGATFTVTDAADGRRLTISMKVFDDEPSVVEVAYADPGRYATSGGWAVVFEDIGDDTYLHYGPFTAKHERAS